MLNWRRDPDYERRINALRSETEQIRKEAEQIERETEQLRAENVRLKALNARTTHLISCVDQQCFPPESSSIPVTSTEPDSRPSSP
jgi:hypothetical protein